MCPSIATAKPPQRTSAAALALEDRFGLTDVPAQQTLDGIDTIWIPPARNREILAFFKREYEGGYPMLFDLTAIDERQRTRREGQPAAEFTVVYQLLSLTPYRQLRIKIALSGESPSLPSICGLWENANWYEREVWDLFGINFEGHPSLFRIMMPRTWEGHPLRKDHPARATEMLSLIHI